MAQLPGAQFDTDVVVVGAGPAGTAAAITVAAHGLDVVCVDKASFPRDKTCGDGLTANALRLLERLGCNRELFSTTRPIFLEESVIVSPSGRRVALPMPHGRGDYAAVVARRDLDAMLVELARTRGVDVREGEEVTKVAVHDDSVEVATTNDHWRARYVIAADGHWSPVRRFCEPDAPRDLGEWHAVRQYFDGVDERRLWVAFARDLLPGYAWVFPMPDGRANVGYGVLRAQRGQTGGTNTRGRDLKALWPDLLNRPLLREILGPHATPAEPVRAWPIPTRYEPGRLAHGSRVLFAGDAAGVVDPMTGEGIAQAIETGMLAAEAIATGADYRSLVHRTLGRDLRFAGFLQRILAHPLGARAAIRVVDTNDWTRRNFARWMWEDYPRALLGTPDRWKRGAFSAPGAWPAP